MKSREDTTISQRGRPRRSSTPVMVRLSDEETRYVDSFIAKEGAPFITRPEAIRRLIRYGFDNKGDEPTGARLEKQMRNVKDPQLKKLFESLIAYVNKHIVDSN